MVKTKVAHKSDIAGPFNRGDTMINKQFTLFYSFCCNALNLSEKILL